MIRTAHVRKEISKAIKPGFDTTRNNMYLRKNYDTIYTTMRLAIRRILIPNKLQHVVATNKNGDKFILGIDQHNNMVGYLEKDFAVAKNINRDIVLINRHKLGKDSMIEYRPFKPVEEFDIENAINRVVALSLSRFKLVVPREIAEKFVLDYMDTIYNKCVYHKTMLVL